LNRREFRTDWRHLLHLPVESGIETGYGSVSRPITSGHTGRLENRIEWLWLIRRPTMVKLQ
jgi:hypothetical protein